MDEKDNELVALIARCAIKDQAAMQELYKRLSPYLNMVAFRIIKSEDLSNDILQEAFVQIWQNAGTYRPHMSKPLTWMTSIVRYRALDRLQHERRLHDRIEFGDRAEFDETASQQTDIGVTKGPDTVVEAEQTLSLIEGCLDKLNDKIKDSMKLAYLHGYSREELAQKFDTKINTIKSWLHRGSDRLKECLKTKLNQTA